MSLKSKPTKAQVRSAKHKEGRALVDVTAQDTLHWIGMGRYFGYPSCCIASFLEVFDISEAQEAVHEGHGFLPCHECSVQILEGKKTLASLIRDRQCPTPFPQEPIS